MRRKAVWTAVLALSVIALIVWNVMQSDKSLKVSLISAQKGSLSDHIYANGKVEAVRQYTQYANVSAVVNKVLVKQGDKITKGQTLVTFNMDDLERQLKQENNKLKIMQEERENKLKQHFETIKKKQAEQGYVTPEDAEKPDTTADDLNISNQKLVIEGLQSELGEEQLTAAGGGIVTELDAEEGQSLPQGAKVLVIMDVNSLQVRANLNELDAGKVRPGMEAEITGDAFQNTYKGKVISVAAVAGLPDPAVSKDPVVEVLIGISGMPAGSPNEIKPGYDANVEFSISHKPQLLLPLDAVIQEGDQSYVFKQVDGKAVKAAVKTGGEDETQVEILSGIGPGDKVIAKVTDELQDGEKVEAP